jgi:ABC-type Mn2+/Zn2+ transport system ATPase subunit
VKRQIFYLPQLQTPEIHLPYTLGEIARLECGSNQPIQLPWFDETLEKICWNQASGGQKMKALLARAFCSSATFLMLDEPFNHLDGASRSLLSDFIVDESNGIQKRSFLIVSHDTLDSAREKATFKTLQLTPLQGSSERPLVDV